MYIWTTFCIIGDWNREMSSQDQVNAAAYQYVLYYMGVDQKDAGVYPTDLSGVCTLSIDGNNQIVVNGWTLGASYPAPTNATLLGYDNSTILTWYAGYYANPIAIAGVQPFSISSANLAGVRTSGPPIKVGYVVYNSDLQVQQRWSGSAWVSLW
jgi:hypothetical protein